MPGVREITVRLNRPEQLFTADRITPGSPDYTEFTAQPAMDTVRDMLIARMPRHHSEIRLIVLLPETHIRPGLSEELSEAVRRWVRVQNIIDVDTTGAGGAIGRRLFVICMGVFMVLQTVSILVKKLGDGLDNYLIDAVGEGLSVASWVILWFPVQLFTVEVWRSRLRRRRTQVIDRITVTVQAQTTQG
jgi:hypothetical protein